LKRSLIGASAGGAMPAAAAASSSMRWLGRGRTAAMPASIPARPGLVLACHRARPAIRRARRRDAPRPRRRREARELVVADLHAAVEIGVDPDLQHEEADDAQEHEQTAPD
jgi:hypothetical protein